MARLNNIVRTLRNTLLILSCLFVLPLAMPLTKVFAEGEDGAISSDATDASSTPFDKHDLEAIVKGLPWWDPYCGAGGYVGAAKAGDTGSGGATGSGGSGSSGSSAAAEAPADTGSGGDCSCGGSGTTLTGNDNVAKAFNYFTGKGLSNAQAAGIVGNLMQESNVDPGAVNTAGGAGGSIAQWEGARWAAFQQFASGKDQHDLAVQLDFMWAELNGTPPASKQGGLAEVKSVTGDDEGAAAQAADKFEAGFERAGNPQNEKREANAKKVLGMAKGGSGGGASSSGSSDSSSSTSSCSSAGSGNAKAIVDKAKEYSWPDGSHGSSEKPEYKAALGNKSWNPSGNAGLDCGVFVALVMRSSGADPDYPGITTGAQLAYMKQHSDKYQEQPNQGNTSNLQPGDILVTDGHTYIFSGSDGQQSGFDSYSASIPDRAANADKFTPTDYKGQKFTVMRFVGGSGAGSTGSTGNGAGGGGGGSF